MILKALALYIALLSPQSGYSMTLRENLWRYEDQFGVMEDRNQIIDGNALLYTGAKFVLLAELGELSDIDPISYRTALNSSLKEKGLLERYNKPGDHQTHDDYVGMFAASMIFDDGQFAREAVAHGRKNWYAWDNQKPGNWSPENFFVRFPGFWAQAKAAAGEWLNPFDQLMTFVNLIAIVFYENGSSGTLMNYLQYKTYMRKCSWWTEPLTRLGCVLFRIAYHRRHPLGIKESYLDYFGPEYPFSKLPDGTF